MGTVNGLESRDFGPVRNTQRLILPAGRQWEKDMGVGRWWIYKGEVLQGRARAFLS